MLRRRNRELLPQPLPPPLTSPLASIRPSPRPALFLHLRIIVARGRVRSLAVTEDTTTIRTVILYQLTCSRLLYSRPIRKSLLLWPPTPMPRSTVRAKLSTSTSGSLSNSKRRPLCPRYQRRLLYMCAAVCHQSNSFINS